MGPADHAQGGRTEAGQRFYCQYDFGDNWQFHGRLHQIPARVGPALWAHARLTDTPAALDQLIAHAKAPSGVDEPAAHGTVGGPRRRSWDGAMPSGFWGGK